MPYWIAIHLPQLPLDALQPHWPDASGACLRQRDVPVADVPVVVLDQERVLRLNASAHAVGVRQGQRRAGVQALAPQATQLERNLAAEAERLRNIALSLLIFTPQVVIDPDGAATLLLETSASLRLFGGHRALCRAVAQCVRVQGSVPRLGCGLTARGAAWLARAPMRSRQRRAVREARMTRLLDTLPVEVLAELTSSAWLEDIGCRTLADLRRLPRAGLARRGGTALMTGLDQAYGAAPEVFDWFAAPLQFAAHLELPGRVENSDAILHGAERLLAQLAGWLAAHQAGVTRYVLTLEHEWRRRENTADGTTSVTVALAQPSRVLKHLMRLLKERIAQVTIHAPVVGLRLAVDQVSECAADSGMLFPDPAARERDAVEVLDTLMARLGAEHVLQPMPRADHRPERASQWMPCDRPATHEARRAAQAMTTMLPGRPAWLLETPVQLHESDGGKPFYGTPLSLRGPAERIESGWWDDGAVKRDYFVAESAAGVRYWIFRVRIPSGRRNVPAQDGTLPGTETPQDDGKQQWFLHGLFG